MTDLFIIVSIFFPRCTLAFCWLMECMPANSTPFAVDFLFFLFAPRFLIAWWLYEANAHPLLIGLFILVGLGELLKGSSTVNKKIEE